MNMKQLEDRLDLLEARLDTLGRRLSTLIGESPDTLSEDDAKLFDALKEWRRTRAAERNVPPYVVIPDKALATIASSRPTEKFDLLAIKGVSDKRVTDYGDDIIAIVNGEVW